MQKFPPRLSHLLAILARAQAPVPVNGLAELCGVSRRTIFREMENIDGVLKPYGMSVDTKIGEGLYLLGQAADKARLLAAVADRSSRVVNLLGRGERRLLLELDLLTGYEPQKLYYYAYSFKVSEATISHDLEALDLKLNKFGIKLVRRPGYGIIAEGGEEKIRSAICSAVEEARAEGQRLLDALDYPPENIANEVRQLMESRFNHHLLWITQESREALFTYIAVCVERITGHSAIVTLPEQPGATRFLPMADYFANSLELVFPIVFNELERRNLATVLSSLRQASSPAATGDAANDHYLKLLAYRMIENFDAELAPFLKLDDRLVDGLAVHMQPALVRVKNRVTLNDPLLPEISRSYPDILEKSMRALKALEELPRDIPESEASFLATHFGAAVMRIRGQNNYRRVKIAVVCQSGIGTSYFMASQLGRHFASRAEIEISGLEDVEDWSRFDLCVTTIPLADAGIPTVRVSTILEEDDIAAIARQLDELSATEQRTETQGKRPLKELCQNAAEALRVVAEVLTYFDAVTIEKDCDFNNLARLAGYRFGELPENGRMIYEDLIRREGLSTQVVPELELILLHARTGGVKGPVFSLILPEGGRFTSPALQGSRCCVVMLVPTDAGRDTLNIMGLISSALLEDEGFLGAVLQGDKARVYRVLEDNFRNYLAANIIF